MGYILETHRLIGKSSKQNMGYIFNPHVELAEGIASQE